MFTLRYKGGFRGGKKVVVEPHRHEGVFIARGKEDALVTKNLLTGESVYGEKRIAVEVCFFFLVIVDFFSSKLKFHNYDYRMKMERWSIESGIHLGQS